jgi:hypothetical protein
MKMKYPCRFQEADTPPPPVTKVEDPLPTWWVCKVCGGNYLAIKELQECQLCTEDAHMKICVRCEKEKFPRKWERKMDCDHPFCPTCEEGMKHNSRDDKSYGPFERD